MLGAPAKVKEVDGYTAESIPQSLLSSSEPLILKGLVSHWPMVCKGQESDKALKQQLISHYNGTEIGAFLGTPENGGRYFYNADFSNFNFSKVKIRLDELFAHSEAFTEQVDSPTYYVGSASIDGLFPGLRNENDLAALKAHHPLVSIWMGNRSRIAAHQDSPQNIACCVAGNRRFTLFPPEQLENLYIGPLDFTPAGQAVSVVDFHQPDLDAYPKFADAWASARVAELAPGDALLLPSMWWHHVESDGSFNVLVNYWWSEGPEYTGAPMDALQHSLMNIRQLPQNQRQAWKALFDYYVFAEDEQTYSHIPDQVKGPLNGIDESTARQLKSILLNKLNR